jgi:hypothetical protein
MIRRKEQATDGSLKEFCKKVLQTDDKRGILNKLISGCGEAWYRA